MENLFTVANCKELGDFVIAGKPLEEGQVILNEKPILSFPGEPDGSGENNFICVSCFRILTSNCMICFKCKFPICSTSCSQDKFHSELECKLFAEKGITPTVESYWLLKYARVYLAKNVFPERFQQLLLLSSEISEKMSSTLDNKLLAIWVFLSEKCQLSVTMFEVRKILQILTANTFTIEISDEAENKYRGYSVYASGSKFSHCCQATVEWFTVQSLDEEGVMRWNLRLHCKQAVQKGVILSVAYTDDGLNYGTVFRRQIFHRDFPFECLCSRCVDVTEGGTLFSAHKCSQCKRGNLLPENPLSNSDTSWKCSDCPCLINGKNIEEEIDEAEDYIMRSFGEDNLDSFIKVNSGKKLHYNHFLIFQVKLLWLTKSDFNDRLMMQSKMSGKLFTKIMRRYSNCIPLVKKFMPSFKAAQLDLIIVDAVSTFAFKSTDAKTINAEFEDPSKKLRFARLLLKHLDRGRFWMHKQPKYEFADDYKNALDERCSLWSLRCDSYAKEVLAYQQEIADSALLQLRSLIIE